MERDSLARWNALSLDKQCGRIEEVRKHEQVTHSFLCLAVSLRSTERWIALVRLQPMSHAHEAQSFYFLCFEAYSFLLFPKFDTQGGILEYL